MVTLLNGNWGTLKVAASEADETAAEIKTLVFLYVH